MALNKIFFSKYTIFFLIFIAFISLAWNFLLSPPNKIYLKPLKSLKNDCKIEGKTLYIKHSFKNSFWQYYFKGTKGMSVDYEVLYEDEHGLHPFLHYKNRFGEGAAIRFINESSENVTIFYSNTSPIVFFKEKNPFSKELLLIESNGSKFFESEHKTVCTIP